jgi:CheY-like chemotaxis protein
MIPPSRNLPSSADPYQSHDPVIETLRCMIVDDNRAFMTVATDVLERDGVSVVATATSRATALESLERLRPTVTLVDIELGAESGFDLANAIHQL